MSVTPKVRVFKIQTNPVATVTPPTMPACIIGPTAQILPYDKDKIKTYIGLYGKTSTASIQDKKDWLLLGNVVPCFSGEYKGLDEDAVPNPSKTQIIGENVVVVVGISALESSPDATATGGMLYINKNLFLSKPLAGDKIYLSTSKTATPNVYTIVNSDLVGQDYILILNPAPADGNYYWIVERQLKEAHTFDNNYIWPSSSNIKEFYIYQGDSVNGLPIINCKLYNSLVAPKIGISYSIKQISSLLDIESEVGLVSEENPLALALYKALSVATTSVYYIPVRATYYFDESLKKWIFSYANGFMEAKEKLASNTEIYRVVPLSSKSEIVNIFKLEAEERSLPEESVFRKVYGSIKVETSKVIAEVNSSNISAIESVEDNLVNVIDNGGNPILTVSRITDLPIGGFERMYLGLGPVFDKVEIIDAEDNNGSKLYNIIGRRFDIFSVNVAESGGSYELLAFKTLVPMAESNIQLNKLSLKFIRYTGETIAIVSDITTAEIRSSTQNEFGSKRTKIIFSSFNPLSSGVEIGHYIEIQLPLPGFAVYNEKLWGFTLKQLNEKITLQIANVTNNSITVVSTEPIWNDVMLSLSVSNPTSLKIIKQLSKSEIVEEIDALTNSLNSSAVINIFPWTLTTLVSGEYIDLPAYYYAAALAALRSVLPVHKSVTRYSIPGFKIPVEFKTIPRNAIESISNIGVFVLVQNSDAGDAYCFHQLTTTRSGIFYDEELSCSENLDEIARSAKKLYDVFIGRYNITSRVIGILYASIESLLRGKMASFYPDCGPQIESFSNLEVVRGIKAGDGQFVAKPGYVSVSFSVKIPEVLNNIDVYIYY
ncbi:MAG: hypothetical protein ABIM30_00655 [candidate division WOR-3 bacterium]